MRRIALFASGTGTNAINLIESSRQVENLKIPLLIIDNPKSPLLKQNLEVTTILISKDGMTKAEHEQKILSILMAHQIDWILLAGYMRILSSSFLKNFWDEKLKQNRVLNIHPSLLPKFPGKNSYHDAFISGEPFSGVTIHFVNDLIDDGDTLLQMKFDRKNEDTFETFVAKGKEVEWKLYPLALNYLRSL